VESIWIIGDCLARACDPVATDTQHRYVTVMSRIIQGFLGFSLSFWFCRIGLSANMLHFPVAG